MSVIIGIDPHKALHAACAIDRHRGRAGRVAGARRATSARPSCSRWAAPFECRTWAIESAGGLGYLLAQQLVARGEHVRGCAGDVVVAGACVGLGPVEQERRQRRPRGRDRSVAVTVDLAAVRAEDHVIVLRLLAKAQLDIGRARSRACCRLHALGARVGARAGSARKSLSAQAESAPRRDRAGQRGATSTTRARARDSRRDPCPRRQAEAIQGSHHRGRHRVGDVADRHLRSRPDHRRDRSSATPATSPGSRPPVTTPPTTAPPRSSSPHRDEPCTGCRDAGTEP